MGESGLDYNSLVNYYQIQGSDKWSPIIKNADAFYKYLAPALPIAYAGGYINKKNEVVGDDTTYLYCLQGDRALQQRTLFRNRLNYKDSEWQAGSYVVGLTQGDTSIQLRYNANDPDTSDPSTSADLSITHDPNNPLEAEATFEISTYVTQYCSTFLYTTPMGFKRYDVKVGTPVKIEPIPAQQRAIESNANLQQQLIYIYGPQYIKTLGDLSTKYLDEISIVSATRLRELILGNDIEGYYNNRLGLKEGANTEIKIDNKPLLQRIDITGL
jgi:hypothetical protein